MADHPLLASRALSPRASTEFLTHCAAERLRFFNHVGAGGWTVNKGMGIYVIGSGLRAKTHQVAQKQAITTG
jgi:hypothetical protein